MRTFLAILVFKRLVASNLAQNIQVPPQTAFFCSWPSWTNFGDSHAKQCKVTKVRQSEDIFGSSSLQGSSCIHCCPLYVKFCLKLSYVAKTNQLWWLYRQMATNVSNFWKKRCWGESTLPGLWHSWQTPKFKDTSLLKDTFTHLRKTTPPICRPICRQKFSDLKSLFSCYNFWIHTFYDNYTFNASVLVRSSKLNKVGLG